MSNRGKGRGRGRNNSNNNHEPHETQEFDYSAPSQTADGKGFASAGGRFTIRNESPSASVVDDKPKKVRAPPSKSPDELKRNMDIAKSRVAAIIDMLEGDDADVSLKRNVGVAVKHLKAIHDLLDV